MSSKHFVKTEFALTLLVAVCLLFGCSSKINDDPEVNNPNTGTGVSSSSDTGSSNGTPSSSSIGGSNVSSSSFNTSGGDVVLSSSDTGGGNDTSSSSDGDDDTSSSSGISSESGASSSSRAVSSSGGASSSSRAVSSSGGASSSSRAVSSSGGGVSSSSRAGSSSSLGATGGDCSRASLTAAVDSYLAALKAGDHTLMSLTSTAKYNEYDNASKQDYRTGSVTPTVSKFGEGLWKKPRTVDFHRNLIDVTACASFSEVIINKDSKNTNDPPYVIGVRLNVSGGQISEVHVLATTTADWGFDASGYYKNTKAEENGWSELPADQRLTRERLKSDAEAYFKYFRDKTVTVPWGIPCARLEGGMYTGDRPNATCNVGVPDLSMDLPTIWWLADVDYGMVVLFVYFGGADTHLFRILPTGYRYIHTLTAMKQSDYQPPK